MKRETTFGWRQACGFISEHIEVQEREEINGPWRSVIKQDYRNVILCKESEFRLKPTAPEPVRVPMKGDKIQVQDLVSCTDWNNAIFHGFYQGKVVIDLGSDRVQVWDVWRWPVEEKAEEMVVNRLILLGRIQDYLEHGGFFNPEMMEHDKVSTLMMDIRTYLDSLSDNK